MDINNTKQVDFVLDWYNESHVILQEQIATNSVDKYTVKHIKTKLSRCLQMIPYERYETIRAELYDALAILRK